MGPSLLPTFLKTQQARCKIQEVNEFKNQQTLESVVYIYSSLCVFTQEGRNVHKYIDLAIKIFKLIVLVCSYRVPGFAFFL